MVHTPYDGSSKPFTIGLRRLDLATWIEVDDQLAAYLQEKRRLYASEWANVFGAEDGTEDAQREVLALLADDLPANHAAEYVRTGNSMRILDGAFTVDFASTGLPPLALAGLLVQEDLVLMRKSAEGWRLVAASLCFPSAWSLREKLGKPMHAVHAPVPGFTEGTRNANLIERMFDALQVAQPVMRWNWTLFGETRLYHPAGGVGLKKRFGEDGMEGPITLRLERQTLRKLPASSDILFTIRTHINPLEMLNTHPDGSALAAAILSQVEAFSDEEAAYKGLTGERDKLARRLQRIAQQRR